MLVTVFIVAACALSLWELVGLVLIGQDVVFYFLGHECLTRDFVEKWTPRPWTIQATPGRAVKVRCTRG